jgi:hypothetical protein
MRLILKLDMDNAAFGETPMDALQEVARILRDVADRAEGGQPCGTCRDFNGNSVGKWTVRS